jgi:hypothetical protein
MIDVAVAYNRYKFLGYEFLTWLWFAIEKDQKQLRISDPDLKSLEIGNRVVLENRRNDALETITIKGDEAGLEEGILALRKGAVVTEINLAYKAGDQQWRFTIKGENLSIAGLKPPDTGAVEKKEDIEGVVLEKAYLYEKVFQFTDNLYQRFIRLRVSNDWNGEVVPRVKAWIHNS